MTRPHHRLAAWILSLAVLIAPPTRRDWAVAMRAELPHIETGQWSWAMGSLMTAFGQALGAETAAGKVRMLTGVLVVALGLTVIPMAVANVHAAVHFGVFNPYQPVIFTILLVVTSLLMFGGASLLLASLAPSLASAGRWLFGFGGLGYALLQFSVVFFNRMGHYPFGWQHLHAALDCGFFALAGLGLLGRLERVYWVMASGAAINGVLGAAAPIAGTQSQSPYFLAVNGLVVCLPALLLLAGGNLLNEGRRTARR